jgi:hypothetical protein
MTREAIRPTIKIEEAGTAHERESHSHPAFAQIGITRFTCMPYMNMFGSSLKHYSGIRVEINRAKLDRHLNDDHIHQEEHLLSFTMSESQWATFVSSIGQGGGVPITLTYAPAKPYRLEQIPAIRTTSVREVFAKEIKDKAENYMAEAKRIIGEMVLLLNSQGSVSKTKLRELVSDLEHTFGGLPETMRFIQTQFDETMEKTVAAGKSEIEGFAKNLFVNAGLKHLADQVRAPEIEGEVVKSITNKE